MSVTQGLSHVYIFINEPMEKGIVDVNLVNFPIFHGGNGENSSYGDRLHNRAICFSIINTWLLMKDFSNKSRFITVYTSISLSLDLIYPLGANNVHRRGWVDERPYAIFEEGIKLFLHGLTPFRIFGCNRVASRFTILGLQGCMKGPRRIFDSSICELPWLDNTMFRMSCHSMCTSRRPWFSGICGGIGWGL
jgi:hypothetical protein